MRGRGRRQAGGQGGAREKDLGSRKKETWSYSRMLQTLWEGGGVDSVSILRTQWLCSPIEIQSTTERQDRSDHPACVVCIIQYRVLVVQRPMCRLQGVLCSVQLVVAYSVCTVCSLQSAWRSVQSFSFQCFYR